MGSSFVCVNKRGYVRGYVKRCCVRGYANGLLLLRTDSAAFRYPPRKIIFKHLKKLQTHRATKIYHKKLYHNLYAFSSERLL